MSTPLAQPPQTPQIPLVPRYAMEEMHLKLFAEDEALREKYKAAAATHNEKIKKPDYDAGFDLFTYDIPHQFKVNTGIQCSATLVNKIHNMECPTSYYLYPRSSISKTFYFLANSVGIIDAGYRGIIMAMLRREFSNNQSSAFLKGDRHFQLCAPDLRPVRVTVVDTFEELGAPTLRGHGGFGSTGL